MVVIQSLLLCTTILFGICAQMLLLDVRFKMLNRTQRIFFVTGNLLVLFLNTALSIALPIEQYMKIYVLAVHIPVFLVFWITIKVSAIKIIFSLFTAVFLIYPANVVLNITSRSIEWHYPIGLYIIYITVCSIMLLIIFRFFKANFNYLIKNYQGISFIKLCLLPLAYYIANYWLGMYSYGSIKTTENFAQRITIFAITLIAYALILDIAEYAREKESLQGAKMGLSLLLESADQQLSILQSNQEQAAVYRHDMRHHLALIGGYLADGEIDKAKEYIRLAQADIEDITPNRYCENNTINLILSFFDAKAKKKGVQFSVDAKLNKSLSISETELCTLVVKRS